MQNIHPKNPSRHLPFPSPLARAGAPPPPPRAASPAPRTAGGAATSSVRHRRCLSLPRHRRAPPPVLHFLSRRYRCRWGSSSSMVRGSVRLRRVLRTLRSGLVASSRGKRGGAAGGDGLEVGCWKRLAPAEVLRKVRMTATVLACCCRRWAHATDASSFQEDGIGTVWVPFTPLLSFSLMRAAPFFSSKSAVFCNKTVLMCAM